MDKPNTPSHRGPAPLAHACHAAASEPCAANMEALSQSLSKAKLDLERAKQEIQRALCAQAMCELARAFELHPKVDAIHTWARSMDFEVALGSSQGDGSFYALPKDEQHPGKDKDGKPIHWEEHDEADLPDNDFKRIVLGMLRECGALSGYDVEKNGWIERSDPKALALAFRMEWMPAWLEAAALESALNAEPTAGPSRASGL